MLSQVLVSALLLPLAFLFVLRSAGALAEVKASAKVEQAAAGPPPAEQARMDAQNIALRAMLHRDTGALVGFVASEGNHGVAVMPGGDLLLAPGPNQIPQRYRSTR